MSGVSFGSGISNWVYTTVSAAIGVVAEDAISGQGVVAIGVHPFGSSALLLEDGFYLLMEDGSRFLLEA